MIMKNAACNCIFTIHISSIDENCSQQPLAQAINMYQGFMQGPIHLTALGVSTSFSVRTGSGLDSMKVILAIW